VLADMSFETPVLQSGTYRYNPTGSPWTFVGKAGVASNGSGFNNPPALDNQVAFLQAGDGSLQMSGSWISQTVNLAAGVYNLSFQAAQRPGNHQTFAVEVDGARVATVTPAGSQLASYVVGPFPGATAGAPNNHVRGQKPPGGGNN